MQNKLLMIILVLSLVIILTLQIVLAADMPRRDLGIMPVDYVVPEPTNPNNSVNSNNSNTPQRIVYIEPENETFEEVPLQGEVVKLDDFEGYYVELGDSKNSNNFVVTTSNITSNPVIVGKPIFMQQTITITNNLNKTVNDSINLWDHTDKIPEKYLRAIKNVEILEGEELQSEKLLFNVHLHSNETKQFIIKYEYSPIQRELKCEEKSIIDLLPPGAVIKHADLALDTKISKTCTLTVYHEGGMLFENVEIPLDDIDVDMVTSIKHLQSGKKAKIHNNTIIMPTQ